MFSNSTNHALVYFYLWRLLLYEILVSVELWCYWSLLIVWQHCLLSQNALCCRPGYQI